MKRLVLISVLALALIAPMAYSAEILNAKITSMVERIDKNGNDYVRFIVNEDKTLNGTKYTVGVPVMAFGDLVKKAQNFKKGDTLKCIVQVREYKGNQSYTILAFTK